MFDFIKQILFISKQVHPSIQISNDSKVYLNMVINKFLMFIINTLKKVSKLEQNFEGILGPEMYRNLISNCKPIIGNLKSIAVPSKKINDICIKHNLYLSNEEIKFLSCAIEYILAEILELSGNVCRDSRKIRLNNDFINTAIRKDKELSDLIGLLDINITAYSRKNKNRSKNKRSRK